ncbi:hypothetical protein CF15_06120 [Pyrodictium occultum]|uniref:Thioredoxin-like fold domain-containing protein n=1 Tax=Pyrodictium occultum TaxID=2309 RepID=A0A0V8RWA0_PYROC|nr:hypothetical protein CF15_06120 [Pyrodictium occultum]
MHRGLSVSAAEAGAAVPVYEAGIALEAEAAFAADIEIHVCGALDPATEELIANARKAAKILKEEYGIEALIIPSTVYWDIAHIGTITPYNLPVLVINGMEVSEGRVPGVEEIVDTALSLLGYKGDKPHGLPLFKGHDDAVSAAASAW